MVVGKFNLGGLFLTLLRYSKVERIKNIFVVVDYMYVVNFIQVPPKQISGQGIVSKY